MREFFIPQCLKRCLKVFHWVGSVYNHENTVYNHENTELVFRTVQIAVSFKANTPSILIYNLGISKILHNIPCQEQGLEWYTESVRSV